MTLVTLVVGATSRGSQLQLSQAARGIYDDAFIPMNDIRSAQAQLLGLSASLASGGATDASIESLQSALDSLEVARERAMSRAGERCASGLVEAVSRLQAKLERGGPLTVHDDLSAIDQDVDVAVQVYAHDALQVRKSVEAIVRRTRLETIAAMVGSVVVAIVITLLLTRAIVPSIRYAVDVASAVAGGKLDSVIRRRGPSEMRDLLSALSIMQTSIADKIAHIELLMSRQASTHASDMETQTARFETALNHMTLGLCMFDASGRLLVHNKKFDEMFGEQAPSPERIALVERLNQGLASRVHDAGAPFFHQALEDGRTISVAGEAMPGGGLVVTYEDVTERQRAAERLFHLARHDTLTGLPNRTYFREEIETRLRDRREGSRLAILCIDLDRFKLVNDTLGHPLGDDLLRQVARRLLATAASSDLVVRLGGDEFAVVQVSDDETGDAVALAGRLVEVLGASFEVGGHDIAIGASIGVAYEANGADWPDDLLRNADLAMYHAKSEGGGRFRLFESEMERKVKARRLLETDLRVAVAEQKLDVHYQPIVDAVSGRPVGFEALLRWNHPQRGFISPAEFIPLAEETGLIHVIGPWVLDRACREASGWPAGMRVAVNLSPLQFRDSNLVRDVATALRVSRLPATSLELEVTESSMLQDDEATLAQMHDLRALGARISMDDFGTGFSSLRYLCRFPFDTIKIDQSFIGNMREGSDDFAIVASTINLARALRMDVIAEGVETREQMLLLREAGCLEMQGYFFSRPRPARDIASFLRSMSLASVA